MATLWSMVRVGAGMLLLLCGVIGVLLPIIPGLPLLAAGLFLIGVERPVLRRLTARWRRRGLRPAGDAERRR